MEQRSSGVGTLRQVKGLAALGHTTNQVAPTGIGATTK